MEKTTKNGIHRITQAGGKTIACVMRCKGIGKRWILL